MPYRLLFIGELLQAIQQPINQGGDTQGQRWQLSQRLVQVRWLLREDQELTCLCFHRVQSLHNQFKHREVCTAPWYRLDRFKINVQSVG